MIKMEPWKGVAEYAMANNAGLFAVLFVVLMGTTVGLVYWVLKTGRSEKERAEGQAIERENRMAKENNEREIRYIDTIKAQAAAFSNLATDVDCVKRDVDDIKKWIIPQPGGKSQ